MRTKTMVVKNNELYMGGMSLKDIASKYGTPLYVYDEEGIREKIRIFKDNFKSDILRCDVIYASKAFIAPRLCSILKENDFYIDAVSAGDMYLLKKSDFPIEKTVLHGNNKSNYELEMAIDYGLEYIVVDNYTELIRLEQIANKKQKQIKTMLRINPGIHAHTHAYIETSLLDSKFGESIHDNEIIDKIYNVYKNSKYLILDGFHAHIGSQINSLDSFVAEAKTMVNFIERFEKQFNFGINTLDLGGGFAIKYVNDDIELSLEDTLSRVVATVEKSVSEGKVSLKRLMIEPGRAIVGDSGVTLYTCGGKKTTFAGKKYLFIDGGMADNIRPALYQAKYVVEVANRVVAEDIDRYDVVGKCCESGDIIATDVQLSEVHKNDTMIVYSTGAYCYSMSMNYNGLVRGGVVFVYKNKVHEVIKRQSFENLVSTCVFDGENE